MIFAQYITDCASLAISTFFSKGFIIEDLEQTILARYLPDSMLIERGLKFDVQVAKTAKMLKDGKEFDKILSREEGSIKDQKYALNKNAVSSN